MFLYSETQYIAKSVGCCCRKLLNVSVKSSVLREFPAIVDFRETGQYAFFSAVVRGFMCYSCAKK